MRAKTFSGGYSFKGYEGQPKDELINLGTPPKVIIPLSQGFGTPPEPIVKVGDKVYAGQVIACDDNKVSSPVHSSVNGRIIRMQKMNYFKREVSMAIIESETGEDYRRLEGHTAEWDRLPREGIEKVLYTSGVTSLDREGIPTRFKTSIIGPWEVEDLIIHGVGSEAYNTSLELLLKGKELYKFVEGIKILKKVMPQAVVHLALNENKKSIIERIKKLSSGLHRFRIYPMVPKYPQGYDEVLIPTLLNKKFPYGYSAANISIVVLNIQAVIHAFEAVVEGKPVIERKIALCGPSFKENIHVNVKVGTPLEFILKDRLSDISSRIVLNSLLAGPELNDLSLPVDKTFSQIIAIPEDRERRPLAFLRPGVRKDSYSRAFLSYFLKTRKSVNTNLCGEERPCIQCGYCLEVCPVKIIPSLLHRLFESGITEPMMRYGIFNCIDCNLCTHVCPSKIPLAKNMKDAKARLIDIGCDHSLCILPRFNLKGLEEYKGVKVVR